MRRRAIIGLAVWGIALLLGLCISMQAQAAQASVTFGSEEYSHASGETFPVGVYVNADEPVGNYYIEMRYDRLRLSYVDGASSVNPEEGILTFEGSGEENALKFWLRFEAVSGGEAGLEIVSATMTNQSGEAEFEITTFGSAPVHLSGEDSAAAQEEAARIAAEEEAARIAAEEEAARMAAQEEAARTAAERQADAEQDREKKEGASILYNTYFVLLAAVVVFVIAVELMVLGFTRIFRRKKRTKPEPHIEPDRDENWHDVKFYLYDLDEDEELPPGVKYKEPVIRVEDVTMEFHLASANPSGAKEYLIMWLKRQITYRRLYALYHVSFDVYKGEVVGIIGTNGSGKSTLLKIISGALKPTGGHVEVEREKIQFLTLGTGFDMELTARENVYLNGSIIGHSREFLDEHYEEIVEFAELQDFMEEKVKNFSSGMVSRLGFAIATAGEAAEILILDEVLSVGDEFFRKKSLSRIREMIHGGSTVLLVSHAMSTILENCSRCVWIEKGRLRMEGAPKMVCEAYGKMQNL